MYYMKGAPEKVFQQCTSYYKQGSIVPLVAKDWEMFSDTVAAMSSKGLRGMFPGHLSCRVVVWKERKKGD